MLEIFLFNVCGTVVALVCSEKILDFCGTRAVASILQDFAISLPHPPPLPTYCASLVGHHKASLARPNTRRYIACNPSLVMYRDTTFATLLLSQGCLHQKPCLKQCHRRETSSNLNPKCEPLYRKCTDSVRRSFHGRTRGKSGIQRSKMTLVDGNINVACVP